MNYSRREEAKPCDKRSTYMKIDLSETLDNLRKRFAMNDYGGFKKKAAEKGAKTTAALEKYYKKFWVHISCKRAIDCTSALMFVDLIHPNVVQERYWIADSVIKMLMNSVCTLMFVCCPYQTFKMALMTSMLALMKLHYSLLYAEWRIWMPKSVACIASVSTRVRRESWDESEKKKDFVLLPL